MQTGSKLVSNPIRMAVRSSNDSLQNSVGVHLRLKSAQECGLVSSAFTAELVKTAFAFFFGGMMVSCASSELWLWTLDRCLRLGVVVH